jgi:YesN/AraC family two-component response regulator
MNKVTWILFISVVSILSMATVPAINGKPEALIGLLFAGPYLYFLTHKRNRRNEGLAEISHHPAPAVAVVPQKQTRLTPPNIKMEDMMRRVDRLMEEEKLYQEPELTLQQLAEKLELPTYQVSVILNEGMQKSFYDLVNGHRVEEAKRLLLDRKNLHYTILSVGFEAGFNSKTTFNTVFKKFTGFTPTEYREMHGLVREAA